jgi:hypothetical protein
VYIICRIIIYLKKKKEWPTVHIKTI